MALELPAQVDIDLQRSRLASVKLTKREELALVSVKDKELRGLLAQLVRSLGGSQQNFERVALQFPLSPSEGGVVLGPESVGAAQLKAGIRQLGIVTSLPSSGTRGDRCIFDTGTAGVYWELLYTGEETYPWAKIGGPPLKVVSTNVRALESEGYADLPTDPLSIEAPLDGEYRGEINGKIEPAAGEGNLGHLSFALGQATAAGDDWSAKHQLASAVATEITVASPTKRAVIGAGEDLAEKARSGGAYSVNFGPRTLTLDPVRVG